MEDAGAHPSILHPPILKSPQVMHNEKNQFLQEMIDPVSSGLGSLTGVVTGIKTMAAEVVDTVVAAGLSLCFVWASGGKYVKSFVPDSVMTVEAVSPVGTVNALGVGYYGLARRVCRCCFSFCRDRTCDRAASGRDDAFPCKALRGSRDGSR